MRIPPKAPLLQKQRHVGRFFSTAEMLEILSIYYGATAAVYRHTWEYRTLIAVHREQQKSNALRKCIKKEKDINGRPTGRWLKDEGIAIKQEVIEYARRGRLPLGAMQLAAAQIREVELKLWVDARVEQKAQRMPMLQAAE